MSQASRRVQRFEKEIRQLSSEFIMRGVKIPLENMASVSRVQVSPDLRNAKVFINFTGAEEAVKEDLENLQAHAKHLQTFIHSKLRAKFCPRVTFYHDTSYDNFLKVERILHEISEQKKHDD